MSDCLGSLDLGDYPPRLRTLDDVLQLDDTVGLGLVDRCDDLGCSGLGILSLDGLVTGPDPGPVDGHWTVSGRGDGINGKGFDFRRTQCSVVKTEFISPVLSSVIYIEAIHSHPV